MLDWLPHSVRFGGQAAFPGCGQNIWDRNRSVARFVLCALDKSGLSLTGIEVPMPVPKTLLAGDRSERWRRNFFDAKAVVV